MKRIFIVINLIVCIIGLQSCSNYKQHDVISNYGIWKKATQETLFDEFSNSLPNRDTVNRYGTQYYYQTKQGVLAEHNFVLIVSLQFPDESSYIAELDKYKKRLKDAIISENVTFYTIQYSSENAIEYMNETVYDGMVFNFEIISTNETVYTIDFLNAHVWDYYKDSNLVEYLLAIENVRT